MQPVTAEISLNSAQCIKEATHFGYTNYVNICNGATTVITWGGVDWAFALFLIVLGLGFLAGCAILAFCIISDVF